MVYKHDFNITQVSRINKDIAAAYVSGLPNPGHLQLVTLFQGLQSNFYVISLGHLEAFATV